MKLDIILAVLLGFVVLGMIYREWTRLEGKVHTQEERIAKLEQANLRRLPYKSYEELLDLKAAIVILREDATIRSGIIDNISGHADNAMTVGTKREEK